MRDLYDAEKRLTKAIPRMARKAANRTLKIARPRKAEAIAACRQVAPRPQAGKKR